MYIHIYIYKYIYVIYSRTASPPRRPGERQREGEIEIYIPFLYDYKVLINNMTEKDGNCNWSQLQRTLCKVYDSMGFKFGGKNEINATISGTTHPIFLLIFKKEISIR